MIDWMSGTDHMHRFGLSKSKIAAFEQCPKRLWLSVHRPDLGVRYSDWTPEAIMKRQTELTDLAREILRL